MTDGMLKNGFSRAQIGAAITSKRQELIILPTEKCNFRCTYCYEDFEIGKMSETTQRAIELFLDKRVPELDILSLAWFGGEPLVAQEIMLRIARHAKRLCDEHGVALDGAITTNAYLIDDELLDGLLACNQNFFQITLDGWGEHHDAVRKRVDGKGTFDRIWQSLHTLKSRPEHLQVVVRVHIRRDNIENAKQLMQELRQLCHGDDRFRIDFQHLRDLGGDGGKSIVDPVSLAELEGISTALRHILVTGGELPNSTTDTVEEPFPAIQVSKRGESYGSRASDRPDEPYICYASRPNSLLIRADGRIGKCTVAFDNPANDVGRLRDDGSIQLDNGRLRSWIRGLDNLDAGALACPLHEMPPLENKAKGSVIPIVSA